MNMDESDSEENYDFKAAILPQHTISKHYRNSMLLESEKNRVRQISRSNSRHSSMSSMMSRKSSLTEAALKKGLIDHLNLRKGSEHKTPIKPTTFVADSREIQKGESIDFSRHLIKSEDPIRAK